jgi:hypothetical protein
MRFSASQGINEVNLGVHAQAKLARKMKQHMKSHFNDGVMYVCSKCYRVFIRQRYFEDHVKKCVEDKSTNGSPCVQLLDNLVPVTMVNRGEILVTTLEFRHCLS